MSPKNKSDTIELIKKLTAISLVFKQLATNLSRKARADKVVGYSDGGGAYEFVPA